MTNGKISQQGHICWKSVQIAEWCLMDLKIHLDTIPSLIKKELHSELVTLCGCTFKDTDALSSSAIVKQECTNSLSMHCRWLIKLVSECNLKQQMKLDIDKY